MVSLPHGQSLRSFGESQSSQRAWLGRIGKSLRIWRERYRQRRELIELMDTDYRTAADIGMTKQEARNWAERPFWRS